MVHARARDKLAGLLVMATAGTAVLSGSAVAVPAARPAAAPGAAATAVTLVTGDVVRLGGPDGVQVTAARGREHLSFRTHTDVDGDVHVVPEDALSPVSAGRVDPRLFDVTELARSGYGDADRGDLPVIVDYPGATPRAAGARAVRELPSVSAVAMRAEKSPSFWATARTSANRIWLDGPVRASLEHSVPQIGAPAAWAAGHTGAGVTVAVLDSGIDTTHPDLADAVVGSRDFTESEFGTDDRYGHGTHIASTITGDGETNKGVAPDAKLLNGKVISDSGGTVESRVIAGMEWAANSGADVINVSLNSPFDSADSMTLAVDRLTERTGALFVVSAGNGGPGNGTVSSPGDADAALTVGAVDDQDQLAEFSSRGPRRQDGAIKPDITAPGAGIVAAKAAHGQIGNPAGDGYVSLNGTSMAAPHVAGAAAVLAGQHPDWTADQLKSRLMSTSEANPDLSVFEQGAGRVDVARATRNAVSAAPGSLNLGTTLWPHHDDQPIAKTITYTNPGTEPVTMAVTADLTGPGGKPAPAGMFTVSPAQVTVPAGGTAQVTLTTDTSVEAGDGRYAGVVVATGDEATVRTPATVNREVESYDLRLTFLDHDGAPTPRYSALFTDHENPRSYRVHDESGTVVTRLPRGTYYFDGWIQTQVDEQTLPTAELVEPAFAVTGPAEYTFDARQGVAVGFEVDRPEAEPGTAEIGFAMTLGQREFGTSWYGPNYDGVSVLPSRTSAPGDFEVHMSAQLARPDGTGEGGGFHASPYLYNVSHVDDSGRTPADLVHEVDVHRLATVVSSHAVATPGRIGIRNDFLTMPLPYTLTEYYTPDSEWLPSFSEATTWTERGNLYSAAMTPRKYGPGQTATERWNVGVFGPGFTAYEGKSGTSMERRGNRLLVSVNMYSDQDIGSFGYSADAVGTTQFVRDGQVLVEEPFVGSLFAPNLPAEEATYTVRTTGTQPGPLSSRIDAEWTFRSGHVAGQEPEPIPALAVRFAPDLDDHNAAKAGRKFRFPVYVQRNGAESPGRVNTPTVEISYDDGATWQRVRLTRHQGQWLAEVNHPKNAGFASLRWSISDPAGNTAKATISHAYALK